MTLSIITINYNNCEGMQKTIKSVLAQTWTSNEWIIIDGGSADGSCELIERYHEHFAYCCSGSDKDIYNAMNKGVAVALGEYCLFLNSGDTLCHPDVLAQVQKAGTDADIICRNAIIHEDSHRRNIAL